MTGDTKTLLVWLVLWLVGCVAAVVWPRKEGGTMSRTIRVDRDVYKHIMRRRYELQVEWDRKVSVDEAMRQILGMNAEDVDPPRDGASEDALRVARPLPGAGPRQPANRYPARLRIPRRWDEEDDR
jgi:hypothetical protein